MSAIETYERHTTHTDALDTLGTIPDTPQKRDAIHLAVEYVIAAGHIGPGNHVEWADAERTMVVTAVAGTSTAIGIADPFLLEVIEPGQGFWLVLYPRQITTLRHVWEHPSFPDSREMETLADDSKAEAEAWLRVYLDSSDTPGFDAVMEVVATGSWTGTAGEDDYYAVTGTLDGDYIHFSGTDASGSIPSEFWDHAEIYLGKKLVERPERFSCSC